jgi:transposase
MEATGVYYESIAYHLNAIKQTVHVVLPNTSKHYFSSLNIKTKTDKVDAKVLSRFGVERRHKVWQPPSPIILELRNLTRYYVQLQEQKTSINNIKHSKEEAHEVQKFILQSNKKLIAQIDKQISLCKSKVEALINSDIQLKKKVNKIMTIKGVGLITIATVIAETLGFEHVKNVKQLVSYAGYDIVQRESGTSIKGKTRISKKGNRYIRNALYFPAMVSCRYNQDLKQNYLRIIQKKPSKMIGQVAIQRKLLILIYTLWKNNTEFIEGYKKVALERSKATQDSLSEKELLLN